MHEEDTIVAISTAPGRGGLGVVRLSGSQARAIALPMLRLRRALEAGHAVFGELVDPASGDRIDEVVVTFFASPHSYTTEDVVEISAHGSPVVLSQVVAAASASGARVAEPGEFTMRAFLHGRLDLTQAEAVRDLIEARTLYQAKVAAQQLGGALSRELQPHKKKLVDLIAELEAGIDFAEDDVSVLPWDEIGKRIAGVAHPLARLQQSFAYGKAVHEGITLAIVGAPNVGKSSLFNCLVEGDRAIVTAAPGTTRDVVSETVSIGGIPVRLVDTAGLRSASDEAEMIGIQKSYQALADADMVLVVRDATRDAATAADREFLEGLRERRVVVVENKIDLVGENMIDLAESSSWPSRATMSHIKTSALTGTGIAALRAEILRQIGGEAGTQPEGGFLTNLRHQRLVLDAVSSLEAASQAAETHIPHEMIMIDLYAALRPLDAITGETTADDILNLIFSSFCIGK